MTVSPHNALQALKSSKLKQAARKTDEFLALTAQWLNTSGAVLDMTATVPCTKAQQVSWLFNDDPIQQDLSPNYVVAYPLGTRRSHMAANGTLI